MVLVFGTICIDRIRRVPHLPPPGGYVEVAEELVLLGGEAANTANALHHWGREIRLAGNGLGTGLEGDALEGLLQSKGLPLQHVSRGEHARTPICDVYVTPDGDRTMFGRGFSDMAPPQSFNDLPFEANHWFTAEANMGAPAREVVLAAAAAGMKTYLMDFTRPNEQIPQNSFWQCSTDWAGFRNNAQKNVRWVNDWVEQHGCFTILSDGPNGFVAGSPQMSARPYPPFPAPEVVDTTGAGDMFRAGMLFGLDQNWPVSECLKYAAAAGCLKCRSLGATREVPTVNEIQAHVAAHDEVARHYV